MNRIDTTKVVDPAVQQPWTTKSLKFLQDSIAEPIVTLTESVYFNPAPGGPVVLSGLNKPSATSINDGTFYLGAGSLTLPNREAFFCKGVLNTSAYTGVPIVVPDFTDDLIADPVIFSDGSSKNIHNVRHWKIIDSGTGTLPSVYFYYSALKFPNHAGGTVVPNTGLNWYGGIGATKINNIVHLSGKVDYLDSIYYAPIFSQALPPIYRPDTNRYFSLPFKCETVVSTAIWKLSPAGIFTIDTINWVAEEDWNSSFYFDGLSYIVTSPPSSF